MTESGGGEPLQGEHVMQGVTGHVRVSARASGALSKHAALLWEFLVQPAGTPQTLHDHVLNIVHKHEFSSDVRGWRSAGILRRNQGSTYAVFECGAARRVIATRDAYEPEHVWIHEGEIFARRSVAHMALPASLLPWPGAFAYRVIREVGIRAGEAHGYLMFHAAAVADKQDALLLIGEKGVGKTTLLTMLLESGLSFIGNTRVQIAFPSLRVSAPAQFIAVRRSTMLRSEGLARHLLEHGLPAAQQPPHFPLQFRQRGTLTLNDARALPAEEDSPVRFDFTPRQYLTALSSMPSAGGRLAATIVLRRSDRDCHELRPCTAERLLDRLRASVLTPHDFDTRPWLFSRPHGAEDRLQAAARGLLTLLRGVPAYELALGGDLLRPGGGDRVRRLLADV